MPVHLASLAPLVKGGKAKTQTDLIAAHFVQSQKTSITIERTIFHRFGHDGAGQLLESKHKVTFQVAAPPQQEQFFQEIKQFRRKVPAVFVRAALAAARMRRASRLLRSGSSLAPTA